MMQRTYTYHRWAWLTYLLVGMFAAVGFCRVVTAVGWYVNAESVQNLFAGTGVNEEALTYINEWGGLPRLMEALLMLQAMPLFCLWIWRMALNTRGLETRGHVHSPVGGALVFASIAIFSMAYHITLSASGTLYLIAQETGAKAPWAAAVGITAFLLVLQLMLLTRAVSVLREIWRASLPDSSVIDTEDWLRSRESLYIVDGWFLLTLVAIFVPLVQVLPMRSPGMFGWMSMTWARITGEVIVAIWSLSTIRLLLVLDKQKNNAKSDTTP